MRGEGGVGVERARIPETGSMFSKGNGMTHAAHL